jgi:capsular exopolysaccharide synthesis family protein
MSRFKNIAEVDAKGAPEASSPPSQEEASPEDHGVRFLRPPFLTGEALEQFISLRDAVLKEGRDREARAVGITSARDQEGKTTVAIGLALSLAIDAQKRVLLLDANMRAPAVHQFFKIPESPGLTDLLQGAADFRSAVVQMEEFPLCILPAGSWHDAPTELLALGRFSSVMGELKKAFDYIVLDSPTAMKNADVELIGRQLDGAVLVLETDKTQLSLLRALKRKLEGTPLPILGVVMNRFGIGIPPFLNRRLGLE